MVAWSPGRAEGRRGEVTSHLGTIDVLEDGDGSLVVYSTEVEPDELAGQLGPAIEQGVQGLEAHRER